ncbi:MAG: phosphotransferase enzyme family protein [Treponemataceae bacterium]
MFKGAFIIESVIASFAIRGDLQSVKSFGGGHINSTFVSTFSQGGTLVRYTHQKINTLVFPHPQQLMQNIEAVTSHIRSLFETTSEKNISSRTLTVIPTKNNKLYHKDKDGNYWRTYIFIENVKTYENLDDHTLATKVGKIIGQFQNQLSSYKGNRLFDTIPRFHDMHWRYEQLEKAIKNDEKKRLQSVQSEIDFLLANKERGMLLTDGLAQGKLQERITHNDTKLNNILFDEKTGDALCVIDLDTVMPGTVLFDTGDLIRTATNCVDEDETDLSKVIFNAPIFEAIITGYMTEAHFLSTYEKSLLGESGRIITQIMAVRFLTDFLNGDVYYKIDHQNHNRDRARTQIALMQSMDNQWDIIQSIIKKL